ncbi:hypothetical protein N0V90_012876 [Kalmusia sp. IMI 367209]|nr:hypothetical protein N0V90_012876 [Kalmusia sp. IMI 367209]
MPPSSRTPPLLEPFVRTPRDDSLLLLTSTLGASANWLIARFLGEALRSPGASDDNDDNDDDDQHGGAKNVLLVSWMRDHDFWKQEARRGAGLDLSNLRTQGRFAFVDGLSALFLDNDNDNEQREAPRTRAPPAAAHTLPTRGPPPPGRTPASAPSRPPPPSHTLSSASLAHLDATLSSALAALRPAHKTLVILDNPDVLLATAASAPALTHSALTAFFLALHARDTVSHLLVHLQSDTALLAASSAAAAASATPPQALQVAQRNLVVQTAHMSRVVLGTRVLDTGVARDVSGVLRRTVNAAAASSWEKEGDADAEGREVLYKVHADGGVKVFERGAE